MLTLTGALLLAFNMGWLDARVREIVFSWQMLFMLPVIVFLLHLFYAFMLFWLALAALFLLPKIAEVYPDALPWLSGDFSRNFLPLLLIAVGIFVIFKLFFGKGRVLFFLRLGRKNFATGVDTMSETDGVYKREIVFGGAEDVFLEPVFRGGEVTVVFGGVELDLRKTTLPEGDTYLNIEVVFGGFELRVPDDWKVVTEIDTVFGGTEERKNSKSQDGVDASRRLIVKGDVVFGGCEIR